MQFKISLRCRESNPVLPVNYQYELSAWIYRVIRNADAAYAEFLHRNGHTSGRKSFKLFSFSQLDVPKYRIEADRLLIQSPVISLIIGFYLDRTAEEFIRGLFQDQQFRLGDRASQVAFSVETVEMRPLQWPDGPGPARIRMLSPLMIARKRPDDAPDEYLHPGDPDFGRLLFGNLLDKYQAATGQSPPSWWDTARFGFRVCDDREPRSKLITIKTGTTAQTKVKGWMFDFELDAPRELLEVGVLAGFGRMNAEGFGSVSKAFTSCSP
jgi:CRISPR-associated endoribonuclease Cas6